MKKVGKTTRQFRYDLNQLPYNGSDKQIQGIRSDRVPDELWNEVCDTVQDTGIKTIPKKKKCKKQNGCLKSLTNSCEKKRREKQRRKGKIYPFECRVPKNTKER